MRIKEILLATNDLVQTRLFYVQTLGFIVSNQTDKRISFNIGSSILTFFQNTMDNEPVYHFAFNIPHNQLKEAMDWLSLRAPLLPVTADRHIADFELWNANAVYFKDNNGNLLELIARHDLNNNSDTSFSAISIQCISEIGIAVDNVPAYAAMLIKDHHLSYFPKQPPQEKFAAIGSDSGLLILAEMSRNWFPTNIPAEKFRMEIIIEIENNDIKEILSL